jgi:hypothetical protein
MYVMAVFVLALLLPIQATSISDKPIKQQNPTTKKNDNTAKQECNRPERVLAAGSPPHRDARQAEQSNNGWPPNDRVYEVKIKEVPSSDSWVRWYVCITGLLAALNLAGLFFICRQTAAILGANKLNERMTRLEHRAYIQVDKTNCQFTETGILKPLVTIVNTGRTPAKKSAVWFAVETTRNGELPTFAYTDEQRFKAQPTIPPVFPLLLGSEITFRIDRADWEQLKQGQLLVFVHGKVTYEDVFGIDHWMTMCLVFEPSISNFRLYDRHNETDDKY